MQPFTPRPSQEEILRYAGGRLGIAAVPGAGKTHILSALAAQIIQGGALQDGQEVLIVTLVNSAVDNFETRIKRFFDTPLQALYKYRVRTLHGLAHDIVREKPSRVGLEEKFSILDDREANFIRRESAMAFLSANPGFFDDYFDPQMDSSKRDWVRRQQLPDLLDSVANAFIRSAKDRLLTPEILRAKLDSSPAPLPLVKLGLSIYADYQRALAYRGAVDFDDLIRLALTLLESDGEFLERLQYRYPYILEDEAQDSSRTQERILSLLSGGRVGRGDSRDRIEITNSGGFDTPFATNAQGYSTTGGNWVRVGDPNQAIFETFTTASPELLRAFIRENPHVDMPESGRSQPSVIALANQLIDWVMQSHPVAEVRDALQPPHIQPVPAGDPQQNPPDDPSAVKIIATKFSPEDELEAVVKSIAAWLPDNMDKTVAVLTPRNNRGVDVTNALRAKGIEFVEFLNSTTDTRAAAGSLSYLLAYLSDPGSASKLAKAYQVYRRDIFGTKSKSNPSDASDNGASGRAVAEHVHALLRKVSEVESFVSPLTPALSRGEREPGDWLAALQESEAESVGNELNKFRDHVRLWLDAVTLPVDQLVLTLAQDVFTDAVDLALAHKLALVMRKAADDHAEWRLPELTSELAVIAKNERRFIGFSADDSGFNPDTHKGKVVVTTMHKAKGLEWDRVYLMSVNNYDFPSGQMYDRYISEKWFLRSVVSIHPDEHGAAQPPSSMSLNLEAEALAQLTALESNGEFDYYEEGAATIKSRMDYVRERLRLLYVGITRAKRDLIVTWNSGRQGDATSNLAVEALRGWWEK